MTSQSCTPLAGQITSRRRRWRGLGVRAKPTENGLFGHTEKAGGCPAFTVAGVERGQDEGVIGRLKLALGVVDASGGRRDGVAHALNSTGLSRLARCQALYQAFMMLIASRGVRPR